MIRNIIKQLADSKSVNNSTSLVSLYLPKDSNFVDVTKMIMSEMSGSKNIKCRATRKGVHDSLQGILSNLKNYNKIPKNGLALFSGTTDEKKVNLVIEPINPVDRFFYRCDSKFCL